MSKLVWKYGSIFLIIYLLINILFYFIGRNSDFCIICFMIFGISNFLPFSILNIKGWLAILISAIFYFLLGALVGYLIQKYKHKE